MYAVYNDPLWLPFIKIYHTGRCIENCRIIMQNLNYILLYYKGWYRI